MLEHVRHPDVVVAPDVLERVRLLDVDLHDVQPERARRIRSPPGRCRSRSSRSNVGSSSCRSRSRHRARRTSQAASAPARPQAAEACGRTGRTSAQPSPPAGTGSASRTSCLTSRMSVGRPSYGRGGKGAGESGSPGTRSSALPNQVLLQRRNRASETLEGVRSPKLLVAASAIDLDFRYGCTPAWWQLWKGLYEEGADLVVTPYRGRPVESPWWRTAANPDVRRGRVVRARTRPRRAAEGRHAPAPRRGQPGGRARRADDARDGLALGDAALAAAPRARSSSASGPTRSSSSRSRWRICAGSRRTCASGTACR